MMRNCETIEQGILEMDCSDDDVIKLSEDSMNGSTRKETDDTFDELVKVLGKKYVKEVFAMDIDEDNLEELDVFENENSVYTDEVNEVFEDNEPLSCEYFTVTEWLEYYQLASYFCVVELSEFEKQVQTERKTTLIDDSVELVDLTEG